MKALPLTLFLIASAIAKAEAAPDRESLNRDLRQEAIAGTLSRIEQTVRQGADLNSKALHGESALDYAIRFGQHPAALKLITLGANPNIEDDFGITPLYRAAGDCNSSAVVESLLRVGADLNHRDLYGRTALMTAAHSDCVKNVAILLLAGKDTLDLDVRDNDLESASDLARDGLVDQMLGLIRDYQRHPKEAKIALINALR